MKRIALLASSLSLFGLGCRSAVMVPAVSTSAVMVAVDTSEMEVALSPEPAPVDMSLHRAGDFVVYRFSGSYRDNAVTMTQRVVEVGEHTTVIDMTVDDGGEQARLRLRLDSDGSVKSVAKLEGSAQVPFGILAYELMMNEFVFSADDNVGIVSSAETTMDVAGLPLAVNVSSYRVRVGAHDALMTTIAADDFAWGDVGGEIRTVDGKLLYKAEIIELGGVSETLAAYAEEDLFEGYDFLDDI